MTTTPTPRRIDRLRCWLCGIPGELPPLGMFRSDIHVSGHLCPSCWDRQPRGRATWTRAASALYVALDLPRAWHHTGYRTGWLQTAAQHHGVTAWHDVPRDTPAPDEPFGWLTPDVLEAAAADLQARDEEFQRSLIPPTARRP